MRFELKRYRSEKAVRAFYKGKRLGKLLWSGLAIRIGFATFRVILSYDQCLASADIRRIFVPPRRDILKIRRENASKAAFSERIEETSGCNASQPSSGRKKCVYSSPDVLTIGRKMKKIKRCILYRRKNIEILAECKTASETANR